jgi:hypothetical protein
MVRNCIVCQMLLGMITLGIMKWAENVADM